MTKKQRKWIIIGGVLLLAGVGIYAASRREKVPEYTTADVTRGTLVQSVNETGTIAPAKEIELAFMSGGELMGLAVDIGDTVETGQVLAQTDLSTILIRQEEARASLAMAQAGLDQALAGVAAAEQEADNLAATFAEQRAQTGRTIADLEAEDEIAATQRQSLAMAESALNTTRLTYQQAVDNRSSALLITADSRIAAAVPTLDSLDDMIANEALRQELRIPTKAYLLLEANERLEAAEANLDKAIAGIQEAKRDPTSFKLDSAYGQSQQALSDTFAVANLLFTMLQNISANYYFPESTLAAYKAATEAHITAISAAISALQTSRQALDDARLSYSVNVTNAEQQVAQARLSLNAVLGNTKDSANLTGLQQQQQLDAAQAKVNSARAGVAMSTAQIAQAAAGLKLVGNQLDGAVMTSPIEGVVTRINYQPGEQVMAGQPVLSILTQNHYQIEVDISETDIAKLKLHDPAEVTLDALGSSVRFDGMVYFIEPAATVIQGVTYYKVKITFDPGEDDRIKAGMTADATITTLRKEDVLMIPVRAVLERDGVSYVRVLENGVTIRETDVTLGDQGDNGLVEVLSGLEAGEKVVTFIKEEK